MVGYKQGDVFAREVRVKLGASAVFGVQTTKCSGIDAHALALKYSFTHWTKNTFNNSVLIFSGLLSPLAGFIRSYAQSIIK